MNRHERQRTTTPSRSWTAPGSKAAQGGSPASPGRAQHRDQGLALALVVLGCLIVAWSCSP
ncbi:hypothetical protein HBB16_17300 [Pseudonocardia sp. MCCB 268]|nr:hypothetical protein [Pseudonocardia cytotoxica]